MQPSGCGQGVVFDNERRRRDADRHSVSPGSAAADFKLHLAQPEQQALIPRTCVTHHRPCTAAFQPGGLNRMTTLCACEHHVDVLPHIIWACPIIGTGPVPLESLKRKTPDATTLDVEANRALHLKATCALNTAKSLVARQCDRFVSGATHALDERLRSQENCFWTMVDLLHECNGYIDTDANTGLEQRRRILRCIRDSTRSFDENVQQQRLANDVWNNQLERLVKTIGDMAAAQTHLLDLALSQQENSNQILKQFQQAFETYSMTAPSEPSTV